MKLQSDAEAVILVADLCGTARFDSVYLSRYSVRWTQAGIANQDKPNVVIIFHEAGSMRACLLKEFHIRSFLPQEAK